MMPGLRIFSDATGTFSSRKIQTATYENLAKLKEAKAVPEERAQARFEEEGAVHAAKLAARREKDGSTGKKPKGNFNPCHNAQAAVEVSTMLIVGQHLTEAPNDKQQLQPGLEANSPAVGKVTRALVGSVATVMPPSPASKRTAAAPPFTPP